MAPCPSWSVFERRSRAVPPPVAGVLEAELSELAPAGEQVARDKQHGAVSHVDQCVPERREQRLEHRRGEAGRLALPALARRRPRPRDRPERAAYLLVLGRVGEAEHAVHAGERGADAT